MSVEIMSDVFKKSKTKGAARLVLLALADNANDQGECYPSVPTLAKKAGVREQTAREYLHAFEKIGLITIKAHSEGGAQTSNRYKINRAKIGQDVITGEILKAVRPPSHRARPPLSQTEYPPSVPDKPTPSVPDRDEPSVNHQSEPSSRKRERTPQEQELAELQTLFSTLSKVPEPRPQTIKEKRAAAVRWYQPIRRIQAVANGKSKDCIRLAIERMSKDRLTISAPQSIEQSAISVFAELARKQDAPAPARKVYT